MLYTVEYINERGGSITFSRQQGLLLTSFPLLSGLPVTVSTSQSISQIGGTVDSQLIDPHASTIKGFIRGDGTDGKRKLLSVIRPMEKGTIIVNDQYSIEVYVTETPTVDLERQFPRFEFGVIAPFPFWQRTAETAMALAGIEGKFTFPWSFASYTFGAAITSFFTNIFNGGQAPAFFDLQISATGAAADPYFMDIGTGDFLKLNKSLIPGEQINISVKPDSISAISSVSGDIEGLIDIESSLFSLRPGDNVIKYDAADGRENLNIYIRFSEKFAGVVV